MVLIFVSPVIAFATNFRCGGDIINVGDSVYKVIDKCGEPANKNNVGYTTDSDGSNNLVVEEWVYKEAGTRYIIRVIGNRVSDIKEERIDY